MTFGCERLHAIEAEKEKPSVWILPPHFAIVCLLFILYLYYFWAGYHHSVGICLHVILKHARRTYFGNGQCMS